MLGFEFDGQYIIDPTMDEAGRYPVDGQKYYNISKVDVSRMIKKTCLKYTRIIQNGKISKNIV